MKLPATVVMELLVMMEMARGQQEVTTRTFHKCPRGFMAATTSPAFVASSVIDCLRHCSHDDGCRGMNVCPVEGSEGMTCSVVEGEATGECDNLSPATSAGCFFAQKAQFTETTLTTVTSLTLTCENGGLLVNNTCSCPSQFGGTQCERLIQDCGEAFTGAQQDGSEAVYNIQPNGSAAPFQVRCVFSKGESYTSVLRRDDRASFNQDWVTLRGGLGADPTQFHFFIGLDNLYHLLQQADYTLNARLGWPYREIDNLYHRFKLGPAASSFEIGYTSFVPNADFGEGLGMAPPMRFSAAGHDVNGCYTSRGHVAGWYGTNCSGPSFFSDRQFYWPHADGRTMYLSLGEMWLARTSDFYRQT